MSSSVATTVGGVVVVTHVHPAPQGAGHQQGCVGIQKFNKGRPLALGTVQIMVGIVVLLFGIAMAVNADSLGVYSGAFAWGPLFYIIAGSLTVAAGKTLNRCLVNGAMGVSIVAAVASGTAIILYSLDAAGVTTSCYNYGSWQDNCYFYMMRIQGFSGVFIVFHLLEFGVSIAVARYACSATCNEEPPSFVVIPVNASVAPNSPPFSQAPSVSAAEMAGYAKDHVDPRAVGLTEPPAYNTITS